MVYQGETKLDKNIGLELYGREEITKLLIQDYGASLGIRDQDGNTALEITIQPSPVQMQIMQSETGSRKWKMFKQIVLLESMIWIQGVPIEDYQK